MSDPTSGPVLADQLTFHWDRQARPRLEGLTDAEYHWEPVPDAWGVRRASDPAPSTATRRAGAGDWLIDFAMPEPTPPPVTTIAWRLAHVIVGVLAMRNGNHFGGPPTDYDRWDYAGTAAGALDQLDAAYRHWTSGVAALDDTALAAPVGASEGPWAEHSMAVLVGHINREVIHHLAEVALLRDLYRARGVGSAP